MAQIDISTIQNKSCRIEFRQGVGLIIDLAFMDGDEVPITDFDGLSFVIQLRTDFIENDGELVIDFLSGSESGPDYYAVDNDNARVTLYISDDTSESLTSNVLYHLECKVLDADEKAVDSIQMSILPRPDIARTVIV